ncbi:protein tumorous imaginal discs, mitochondrial-like [Glossina fuscipes]|uniref:Protein tumorous imaginal discs, mitochondrial-like n=1 Tax=Glossina fuscipes TaxID=7396 RepID=A0A8U0W4V2_9MUSC|nr:protein tumorous imaginal discs, mitochondrial-like [Glossina fuscipes]
MHCFRYKYKVAVQIPAGIKSGDIMSVENLRIKQLLNYRIQVKESDYYARVEYNIFTDKHITISKAILGSTFKVRGIYEILNLKLERDTEFKSAVKDIKSRGGIVDYMLTVKVQIPRQLSVRRMQLILTLTKTQQKK